MFTKEQAQFILDELGVDPNAEENQTEDALRKIQERMFEIECLEANQNGEDYTDRLKLAAEIVTLLGE